MNEDKALRLWLDIGGIAEMYVDELEAEAAAIAAKVRRRKQVKVGTIVAAAASIGAAVAIILLKPKAATRQLAKLGRTKQLAA